MSREKKRPGWAFWTTVLLAVGLVAYPVSYVPFVWWFWHGDMPGPIHRFGESFYAPIDWAYSNIRVIHDFYWNLSQLWPEMHS